MKTRKGYEQGYNAQAVVTREQIIVAAQVTQEQNDVKQLHPMIEETQKSLQSAGIGEHVGVALADAGYCSEENLKGETGEGPEFLVATKKDWKQRKRMKEEEPPREPPPEGISQREKMDWRLRTERGKSLYRLRSQTVEPVFGQIKTVRRCDRFARRGLTPARSEWKLLCATHNLLKLWRSGKALWN